MLRTYNDIYHDFHVQDINSTNNEGINSKSDTDGNGDINSNNNETNTECLTYNQDEAKLKNKDDIIIQATQSTEFLQSESTMNRFKFLNEIIDNFEIEMNKQRSLSQQVFAEGMNMMQRDDGIIYN